MTPARYAARETFPAAFWIARCNARAWTSHRACRIKGQSPSVCVVAFQQAGSIIYLGTTGKREPDTVFAIRVEHYDVSSVFAGIRELPHLRLQTWLQSGEPLERCVLQVTGASIQLKGRIRRSFALDAFPCQPQLAYGQVSSSSPNNFIASVSDSDTLPHFFCRLML